jgi:hypothetical protein
MFGMLDYRAYKLLWLICLPIRLIMWIAAWSSIVIAIMISASLDYSVLIRIVIAYGIWQGTAIVLQIIRGILFWFIKKGFFWLVDVVPAKAESVPEAKEMVVGRGTATNPSALASARTAATTCPSDLPVMCPFFAPSLIRAPSRTCDASAAVRKPTLGALNHPA